MFFEKYDLYVAGDMGYHECRIPVLLATSKGTILAFNEGRKFTGRDADQIDLFLRRSFDGGKSFDKVQVVATEEGWVSGNPAPIQDRETGIIWLLFCKNRTDGPEPLIVAGEASRTIWVTCSNDDGATWAEPKEITDDVKDPSWTWYATGPCHGIQLKSGRLMIPCDHVVGKGDYSIVGHSHVIYSDDHGENWQIGGVAQPGTNESVIVQTVDGALYFNCRNYVGEKRRAYAWSYDDGESFPKYGWDDRLPEPICQASMIRFTEAGLHDKNRILFSNPGGQKRERMTIRLSYDECQTWPVSKVIYEGSSSYSDMCIAQDGTICCLYEKGQEKGVSFYSGDITFARFDLEWLTDGADKLSHNTYCVFHLGTK